MIYAIGDIHGMYDPLKILADYIYDQSRRTGSKIKIVFLGDYIDCGPASRQVVDLILQLKQDFETVTLMGNHEEMLLSFSHKTFNYVKVGNFWLSYNGGVQTIRSFYPHSVLFRTESNPNEKTVSDLLQYDDILKLEEVYSDFFNKLEISHIVKLEQHDKEIELLFSHSIPSPRFDLDKQLSVRDWQGLHKYTNENACDLEETLIWNRQLLTQQLRENLTVIHGHTPTRYYKQMTKLLRFWEEEETAPFVVRDKKARKPAQIDIDTGLIYGGSLTMLAIDDSPGAENIFPYYISVEPNRGFRHRQFSKKELDLR